MRAVTVVVRCGVIARSAKYHAWSWVGAAQDGDLVAQHEELDVLGGGRAARQQDQPEHLPEDQVQQPQRHAGIMSDRRSPLVSDPGPTSGTPQALTLCGGLRQPGFGGVCAVAFGVQLSRSGRGSPYQPAHGHTRATRLRTRGPHRPPHGAPGPGALITTRPPADDHRSPRMLSLLSYLDSPSATLGPWIGPCSKPARSAEVICPVTSDLRRIHMPGRLDCIVTCSFAMRGVSRLPRRAGGRRVRPSLPRTGRARPGRPRAW